MAVTFTGQDGAAGIRVFWRDCRMLPGGYTIDNASDGEFIPAGTPVIVKDGLKASILKVAKIVTGGNTTALRVAKGSHFKAGDAITVIKADNSKSELSGTIKTVAKDNAAYDVVTLNAACADAVANAWLVCSGDVNGLQGEPSALTYADITYNDGSKLSTKTVDLVWSGLVLKNVATDLPKYFMQGICLKANPNLAFIEQ